MTNMKFLLIAALIMVHCQSQQEWLTQWIPWQGYYDFNLLKFCQIPQSNGQYCQKCMDGLVHDYPQAYCRLQYPSDYCISIDMHWNCQLCTKGYYVKYSSTWLNECKSKKIGCAVYDQVNKVCTQCNYGYYMNNTQSYWNISQGYCIFEGDKNCQLYLPDGTTCQKCVPGYTLMNNRCIISIPNCQVYNGNTCQKCIPNFHFDTFNNCVPIPKIPNCQVQYEAICQKCISNYFINSLGKCQMIPRISNCQNQIDYVCNQCINGYKLQNNICNYFIENCEIVNGLSCQKCFIGFNIDSNGKCTAIPPISNCEVQIDYKCQKCISGYSLSNNQCNFVIPFCLQVVGKVCTKCMDLYTVNSVGTCSPYPKIPNCSNQSNMVCNKCGDGYNLINNQCVYNIPFCLKINGKICQQCSEGYQITQSGTCIAVITNYDPNCRIYDKTNYGKCIECSQGFYLGANAFCQQVDPLCKTYNLTNGFCTSCYTGFSLNSLQGKCQKSLIDNSPLTHCNKFDYTKNICIKCAEGSYFNSAGICQKYSDINCKNPSKDLKSCQECYLGYYYDEIQEKKCVQGNFNCAKWKNGKCETCPTGFYLDQKSNCVIIDPLCKNFNINTKKCSICYQGYGIDVDFKCRIIQKLSDAIKKYYQNCAKYGNDGNCSYCYPRWFLAKDQIGTYCKEVSQNCRTYNSLTGRCTSCYLGYYYKTSDGSCQRII